jgi:hypothetical protein
MHIPIIYNAWKWKTTLAGAGCEYASSAIQDQKASMTGHHFTIERFLMQLFEYFLMPRHTPHNFNHFLRRTSSTYQQSCSHFWC